MQFLKNLFKSSPSNRGDSGMYVYVKPKMCKEILRVRIDMSNDLSLNDQEDGYFVRKTARGSRCPFPVEMTLHFSKSRQLVSQDIENGTFATVAEYTALYGEEA